MKMYLIIISLFVVFSCKPQESTRDSLGIVSRSKADALISKVDSTANPKLIFSILDKEYYFVVKRNCNYEEYYIETDNQGRIKRKVVLNTTEENKNILSKAFNFNEYRTDFTKEVPNAKSIMGKPSYFVVKDEKGKRYGEFSLSSITLPSVIDKNVLIFLNRRISEF